MLRRLIIVSALVLASCSGCGTSSSPPARPAARTSPVPSVPGLVFVQIPAGTFTFGCEPQDTQCKPLEKPPRTYQVSSPYEMTRTEITVRQYEKCAAAGQCPPPSHTGGGGQCNAGIPGHEDHPMNCVDLAEAKAFCHWIGGHVPSAEEWEYAAKGAGSRVYPWGDAPPDDTRGQFGASGTAPVGTHPASATAQGLQDMAGNVWEWTSSMFDPKWAEVRGGSWRNPLAESFLFRCSQRGRKGPEERTDFLGFRCAR